MNDNASNIVWMSFKGSDLLGGIVIVDSQLEVIGTADNPILSGNEATSANGNICELEGFDDGLVKLALMLDM